nr:UDP-N-acetylmuramoyl-L-alanine--D-glutamate ligase [uncultured Cellulosilyticum sp.]
MSMEGKKVLVIGNARSGIGAAKLAHAHKADVYIYDGKPYEKWDDKAKAQIEALKAEGIHYILGEDVNVKDYDLFITSPGISLEIDLIKAAYAEGKKVTGEFEFASTFCKAPIVAITGTNGKTTTTTLVGEIMKAYNPQTFVVGNIGRAFSEEVEHIPAEGIVVAEVSSFQLETAETFHPKVSSVLNITPDHLNRHHTMENYCQCKYNIFKNQTADEYCILNTRDEYYEEAKKLLPCKEIAFSVNEVPTCGAYLKDNMLVENINGQEVTVCSSEELIIKGTHNIENALAAIAMTTAFGVPTSIIRDVLVNFKGVEHRTEFVMSKGGVDFFNDSKATNTDAARAGLVGLSVLKKPIRLIAGGMDKQISFKDWIALFEGLVEKVYIIGETKAQIVKECAEAGYYNVATFDTFEAAIKNAYVESHEGDCILLSPACASWDMFESYEQRGEIFKEIVRNLEG